MVSRWAQEILGYHFSVLHRPARMMINMDYLTRMFGNLTTQYVKIATLISYHDRACRPAAYTGDPHEVPKATNVPAEDPIPTLVLTILTDKIINGIADIVNGGNLPIQPNQV